MESFKLASQSLGTRHLVAIAAFHLLEYSTILVRYNSSVLSICRTVLFLFLAFLIAAVFLNLATIFLHVAVRRGCCLDLLLYALCSFLLTFRN